MTSERDREMALDLGPLPKPQAIAAALAQARAEGALDFAKRVNERAEADMLAGNPVTGAHHRAIEVEAAAIRARGEGK